MKLANAISNTISEVNKEIAEESVCTLVKLMAPFAPHLAEELWKLLGGKNSIHIESWPKYDETALEINIVEFIIQIKGKVRGKVNIPINLSRAEVEEIALNSQVAKKWLNGDNPSRIIVVPNKLINLVP